MPASPHDQRLSAALTVISLDMQRLTDELTFLCSDLGMGAATSEQRTRVDTMCGAMARELEKLRGRIIPGAPVTIEAMRDG